LHESKTESLVLDYGNNITRHGPVDAICVSSTASKRPGGNCDATASCPAKECLKCHQIVHAAVSVCNECDYEFPKREVNHEREASNEGIISGETTDTVYTVLDIDYGVHRKFGAGNNDPETVRIDYVIQRGQGYQRSKSEWVCPEHSGWARKKFEDWWNKRSNAPPPDTALDVVEIANSGGLLSASEITVRKVAGEKYDRIIAYQLAAGPQYAPGCAVANLTTCGHCSHYAYGYCCVKHDHMVTRETAACNEFFDVNFNIDDDVPF
jgi:DNA repair protein RadD